MRISDWSSDVCSSDLRAAERDDDLGGQRRLLGKLLPPMLEAAREIAETQMSEQIASAVQHARSAFDARIDRLRALARHNRAIDPDQIDRLEASREQLANPLAQARPRQIGSAPCRERVCQSG